MVVSCRMITHRLVVGGRELKALLVQHEDQVPPGRLLEVLDHLKWGAEVIMMEKSPEVPASINEFDCLILLGGTMNVDDVKGYPYLEKLRHLTSTALKAGFPVLGLCLGVQMISRAVGGKVHRNQCGEIGWNKVWLTEEGRQDPVLEGVEIPLARLGPGGTERLARDTREKMPLYNNISRQILLNYFNNI